MSLRTRELALDRDPSSRFLPWIIAALAMVVSVAIGVSFSLAALTQSWGAIGNDRLTVRFAHVDAAVVQTAEETLVSLQAMEEVISVRQLPAAEVATLLSPWLGDANTADDGALPDLPLPIILDVQLLDHTATRRVRSALQSTPGAVVDSTQSWLEPLQQLAGLAGVVAAGLAGLAIAVIALVTVFATRAALAAHQNTIELLRLIGAAEGFIARRFQFHNLKLGLLGGLAGTVPGAVIILLGIGAARLDSGGLLTGLSPTLSGWLTIALLPVMIGLVATVTARFTVLGMLRNHW